MKNIFITLILLIELNSYAQENKVIYAELLGNGFIVASLNYDQRITAGPTGLGFRVGVSIADTGNGTYTFPIMANYLIGKEKHFLELGAGATIFTKRIELFSRRWSGTGFTACVIYRFHASKNKFMFRIGLSPIFTSSDNLPFWGGLSFGWRL